MSSPLSTSRFAFPSMLRFAVLCMVSSPSSTSRSVARENHATHTGMGWSSHIVVDMSPLHLPTPKYNTHTQPSHWAHWDWWRSVVSSVAFSPSSTVCLSSIALCYCLTSLQACLFSNISSSPHLYWCPTPGCVLTPHSGISSNTASVSAMTIQHVASSLQFVARILMSHSQLSQVKPMPTCHQPTPFMQELSNTWWACITYPSFFPSLPPHHRLKSKYHMQWSMCHPFSSSAPAPVLAVGRHIKPQMVNLITSNLKAHWHIMYLTHTFTCPAMPYAHQLTWVL